MACWGDPRSFDLLIDHLPAEAPGLKAIALGEYFAGGLFADGSAQTWFGPDEFGWEIPPGLYTSVVPGLQHACAVTQAASICCWGHGPGAQYSAPGQDGPCPR